VRRLVNATSPAHGVARVPFAGADVDDLRLALADRDRAGALRRLVVEDGSDGGTAVGGLPDAAAGRGDVERIRVALDGHDVGRPAAHVGRPDAPRLETPED